MEESDELEAEEAYSYLNLTTGSAACYRGMHFELDQIAAELQSAGVAGDQVASVPEVVAG